MEMPTFSTITLHNCALSKHDKSPVSLTLKASLSFPASNYHGDFQEREISGMSVSFPIHPITWAARPVPTGGHLVLTLDSKLGEGRTGAVYTAIPTAATDASGVDVLDTLKSFGDLCIKIAKPMFCRSLAREAWFYEHLAAIQGTATARCFGLWTTPIDIHTVGVPNSEHPFYYHLTRDDTNVPDNMPSVDWLDDDAVDPPERADFSDDHGFKRDSAWNEWEPSEEAPILSVLLLEKLGKTYQQELPVESNEPKPAVISDIKAVLDDVYNAGVLHGNISAFNILHTTSRSRCKLHRKRHHWRLVDFDRSRAFDNACDNRQLRRERKLERKDIGLEKNTVFWGAFER